MKPLQYAGIGCLMILSIWITKHKKNAHQFAIAAALSFGLGSAAFGVKRKLGNHISV